MIIFQGSRQSDDIGTLKLIICICGVPWTRNQRVDGFLETGKSFVDAFDLLLTSERFSTNMDSLSACKTEG